MATPGFHQPADANLKPEPDQESAQLEAQGNTDRELLQEVVKATMMGHGEPASPEELEALMAVARRYPRSPLVLQPVGVELVEAVVQTRFADTLTANSARQGMCCDIAESLMEDADSLQRLGKFWSRLVESAK